MADGKTPSPFEIVIFGGPHADLPIAPHAGAIIGEAVAACGERDHRSVAVRDGGLRAALHGFNLEQDSNFGSGWRAFRETSNG